MKKIMIALIGCMILSGCNEDILNLNNPAQFNEGSYFKTQKECQEVIAACYSVLTMRPFWGRDWYFMMDMLSGHAMGTANVAGDPDFINLENLVHTPNNMWMDATWRGFYRMSMRALVAVEKLTAWETKTESEAAYKELMIGEAWFFHGFAYYYLTELYGDVPYHPSWASIKEEPAKARTPYAEVQSKIEEALNIALGKVPESWEDKFLGRITKDAARAMLGKLYLTQGNYDKAITAFESIKASSYHPNYEKLFDVGNHKSPEIIFQVLHKFWGWDQGNSYYVFDGKETWGGKATNCARQMEYGWNDWNNVSIPNNSANKFRYTLNGSDYIDPRNQFIIYGDGEIGSDRWYGFHYTKDNAPSPDKVGELVEYFDEDGKFIDDGTKYPYKPYVPYDPDNLDDDEANDASSTSGYKWKKYCLYETYENMDIGFGEFSSVLIRLADVKLMLAEAYIGKSNYDKAKTLINEVRTRDAVKAEAYSDLNASNAMDILHRERFIELYGELHYWFDLVRWDRLGKVDMIEELKKLKGITRNIDAKYKKFAIPTQEKDTNPLMVVENNWN